jgi:hypothetical protein
MMLEAMNSTAIAEHGKGLPFVVGNGSLSHTLTVYFGGQSPPLRNLPYGRQ